MRDAVKVNQCYSSLGSLRARGPAVPRAGGLAETHVHAAVIYSLDQLGGLALRATSRGEHVAPRPCPSDATWQVLGLRSRLCLHARDMCGRAAPAGRPRIPSPSVRSAVAGLCGRVMRRTGVQVACARAPSPFALMSAPQSRSVGGAAQAAATDASVAKRGIRGLCVCVAVLSASRHGAARSRAQRSHAPSPSGLSDGGGQPTPRRPRGPSPSPPWSGLCRPRMRGRHALAGVPVHAYIHACMPGSGVSIVRATHRSASAAHPLHRPIVLPRTLKRDPACWRHDAAASLNPYSATLRNRPAAIVSHISVACVTASSSEYRRPWWRAFGEGHCRAAGVAERSVRARA